MDSVIALAQGPFGLLSLALIAFGDTLIGIGFFVPGEVAFLAAGSVLAASGDVTLGLVVLISAWLADQASFWLGRRYGTRAAAYWLAPLRRRRHWRKASGMLKAHAAKAIILSRILGPVAWIMPFMSGATQIPARTFVWSSAIGVMIGVGQFILYGALLHMGIASFSSFLSPIYDFLISHWVAALVVLVVSLAGLVTWRWLPNRLTLRMCLSISSAMLVLGVINVSYFFGIGAHAVPVTKAPTPLVRSVCELNKLSYQVKPGPTDLHKPQPINVALLSDQPPEVLMQSLGWLKNKTYSQDRITLMDYAASLVTKELPISELYWHDQPALSAFQLPGSISERVHIRWWQAGEVEGQTLYVAALSRDEELAIKYYKQIPALLHDIARDVDQERDALLQSIGALAGQSVQSLGTFALGKAVSQEAASDYFTDGKVLLLQSSSQPFASPDLSCLG